MRSNADRGERQVFVGSCLWEFGKYWVDLTMSRISGLCLLGVCYLMELLGFLSRGFGLCLDAQLAFLR